MEVSMLASATVTEAILSSESRHPVALFPLRLSPCAAPSLRLRPLISSAGYVAFPTKNLDAHLLRPVTGHQKASDSSVMDVGHRVSHQPRDLCASFWNDISGHTCRRLEVHSDGPTYAPIRNVYEPSIHSFPHLEVQISMSQPIRVVFDTIPTFLRAHLVYRVVDFPHLHLMVYEGSNQVPSYRTEVGGHMAIRGILLQDCLGCIPSSTPVRANRQSYRDQSNHYVEFSTSPIAVPRGQDSGSIRPRFHLRDIQMGLVWLLDVLPWHGLHLLMSISASTVDRYRRRRTTTASAAIQLVAGACLQRKTRPLPPLLLSPQDRDPTEMATASEMSTYESNPQKSPSPSRHSSRSSRAKRTSQSSSSKGARFAENEITEVPRSTEGAGTLKGENEEADPGIRSPSPSKPSSQSSAADNNISALNAAVTLQPNQPEQVSGVGLRSTTDGTKDNSGEGDEDKVTPTERFCREKEKQFPQLTFKPENANAWPKLSDTLREHDQDQVKAQNENIDTLLVLSGLFSAVVATLIVEALNRLQQDPADTTAQLLRQISMQLSSLSVNSGFINSTYMPPPSPPFSPVPYSLSVAILWSISLVLSLVTASLGMLVKQWLREYLAKSNISPEQCCQVRLYRITGLRKYKVTEIASLLPILLQIALILFFIGLILFVQSVHTSITIVVSVFVGIWLLFIVGTTLLPIISPSCPYKTPFLKAAFLWIRNRLTQIVETSFIKLVLPKLPNPLFVEESTGVMTVETKSAVLKEAYETFQDVQSWEIVTRCVDLNSPLESLRMLSRFTWRMHNSEITLSSDLEDHFDQAQLRIILKSMVVCLRGASTLALKDNGSEWFDRDDVAHLVTLRKLYMNFPKSEGSDAALGDMIARLIQPGHIFSIREPSTQFVSSYILSISGLSPSDLPETVNKYAMWRVAYYATSALDSGSGNGAGFKCSASLPHLLEICRISFLCAGRTNEDGRSWWEDEFSQLTYRLVESLQAISYPERYVVTSDVFRAQCALDMAMRLHKDVQGTVDESLLQALHDCSIKMFGIEANDRDRYEDGDIKRRNDAPATDDGPGNVPDADWKKLFDEQEVYVGVQIRDDGSYGNEWYDDDLQHSCKLRIEFMWSLLSHLRDEFREILREFEVGSKT
ncbi:hypothetical protein NLI96_g8541 [Meripilus lineatus]|uniref:DUF6535 domain-containing protein n=1 Tax=Meripilus lineatus TaxID=2056292 RepID=A0AAD5YBX2_9APHY|nr:hypothetical protein NLI96_g8541 [Physisporinus lineatus]